MNLGRIAIVAKGPFNPEVPYKKLDLVEYQGSSFIALENLQRGITPTPANSTSWMLAAKKGKDFKFEDFTPENIVVLQAPLQEVIEKANEAIDVANEAAENALSGIKGIATQTGSPTPYTTGELFERWSVTSPITAPNDWDNLTVTALELEENQVFFDFTNGVGVKYSVPVLQGEPGNQFYKENVLPSIADGNWGDLVFVNNKIYKKQQAKKIRYIRIEAGGSIQSDGIFFTHFKAFNQLGQNVINEADISVTTSHPITEGTIANLYDDYLTTYIYIGNVTSYSDIRWMQVDLLSEKEIVKIEEALYPTRQHHDKKVMVSVDGITWETIFDSNIDGEYVEPEPPAPPSTKMLSGWEFQFNVNTPAPIIADTLITDIWDVTAEPKKVLTLNENDSIIVEYSAGSEGDLTVDGKGYYLIINGQDFTTDDEYKTHFRLLEMNGDLVIIPTVTKTVSESPYKELSQIYLDAVNASPIEKEATLLLTNKIKSFYNKIIALYLNLGADLTAKSLNLVRPFIGKENFQLTFSGSVVNDVNGIKVPSGSTNRVHTQVEPLGLSDLLNYGFFFHKKQLIEGGNWLVSTVSEDGALQNDFGSYHPKSVGSNDYLQMFSSGYLFPSKNEAGLISIRRNSDSKAKISVNRKPDYILDINTDTSKFVPGANAYYKYPNLALVGQNGDAVYSCFGIYQGLTDGEHTILMNAITEFLTTLNRI